MPQVDDQIQREVARYKVSQQKAASLLHRVCQEEEDRDLFTAMLGLEEEVLSMRRAIDTTTRNCPRL